MAYGTRVFIDFWNFQLNWNDRAGGEKLDWTAIPRVLIAEAQKKVEAAGITEPLALEETLVYASYNPATEGKLRGWLESWLDRQPSFNVKIRVRKSKPRKVHCSVCKKDNDTCECGAPFMWAPEKGVDTAIVTDLLSLAGEDAYDVAILVSSDADHIPAVEWIQARGRKVINATWANDGFDLKRTCWAEIELDAVIPLLTR
ncbi:MAG: NYN domain-containing protein [Actinomycetota bacterium]|nr:NYN domain-containing protein [Actinomycetota bacterium]